MPAYEGGNKEDDQLDLGRSTTGVILIVEDNVEVADILAQGLEEEGFTVHTARHGKQALDLAGRVQPVAITLDLGLPDTSGLDVLRALRADPATRAVPVIAVSATADQIDPTDFPGMTYLIQKPFYVSDVVAAVREALAATASVASSSDTQDGSAGSST